MAELEQEMLASEHFQAVLARIQCWYCSWTPLRSLPRRQLHLVDSNLAPDRGGARSEQVDGSYTVVPCLKPQNHPILEMFAQ